MWELPSLSHKSYDYNWMILLKCVDAIVPRRNKKFYRLGQWMYNFQIKEDFVFMQKTRLG